MKSCHLVISAALLLGALGNAAMAMPMSPPHGAMAPDSGVVPVQLQCTPASCIDQRTGIYTQSTCNRRGCFPIGGPVGRVGGGGGYGSGYGRGYEEDRPRRRRGWDDNDRSSGYGGGRGGGGFDCDRNGCIDTSTGAVWESTCDRSGCRPLRPAGRGRRY